MEKKQGQKELNIKKLVMIVLLIIICIGLSLVFLNILHERKLSKDSVKEVFEEYISEYEVLNETSGEIQISVTCPNFEEIVKQMATDRMEITSKNLKQTIENNSGANKEYVFNVTNLTEEEINKAFLDKIAYDLMVNAIQEVEYQERWRLEE